MVWLASIISRPPLTGSSYVPPTASGRASATNTQTGSTPTNSSGPIVQASSPLPIGAIVGGSIGGILLIGVLVAWFIIMYRRRSREGEKDTAYAEDKYVDKYAKDGYAQDGYAQDRRSQDRPVQSRQSQDRYANRGYSRDAYAGNSKDAYTGNTRAAYAGNTREASGGNTREAYPSNTRDAYGKSSRDGNPTGRAVSSRSTREPYPTAKASSRSGRKY
jgi:hypothetical protein